MSSKALPDNSELDSAFDGLSDAAEFLAQIQVFLEKYSDESNREQAKHVGKGAIKHHGVALPVLRKLALKTGNFCTGDPVKGRQLLKMLWDTESREERKICTESAASLLEVDEDAALSLIMEIIPDLDNWELCDSLATIGLKKWMPEHHESSLRMINNWVRSPNPWIRRLGIVSLIPLSNSGSFEDLDVYLVVIKKLMRDEHESVQKAVSWVIREITPKDPERVGKFLEVFTKYHEPSTQKIIREGSKKLDEAVRTVLMESTRR
ncbi:MAG: DNA alkylation repair protein [Firmicutes bacterium]|nr:DNA alkylation repair protein [Bacillota bacterium]